MHISSNRIKLHMLLHIFLIERNFNLCPLSLNLVKVWIVFNNILRTNKKNILYSLQLKQNHGELTTMTFIINTICQRLGFYLTFSCMI